MTVYLCDYGDCRIEKPAKDMIYLRWGIGSMVEIRRFCCTKHLYLYVKEKWGKEG